MWHKDISEADQTMKATEKKNVNKGKKRRFVCPKHTYETPPPFGVGMISPSNALCVRKTGTTMLRT